MTPAPQSPPPLPIIVTPSAQCITPQDALIWRAVRKHDTTLVPPMALAKVWEGDDAKI